MTPNEFRAWFDGFTEAFDGKVPTKTQWERIKARVAEIDGKPVTERVYVDRYWPTYVKTYPSWSPTYTTTTCGGTGVGAVAGDSYSLALGQNSISTFNSSQAMAELGRAEAASLS